ncbi:MAG: rhodanese-like domain-containing protein [Candidatus Adiutrix sp.]|jgi:rhodanese-related sulfurtransferase|nr:rhodanese-like domain-containing protein [Candidatus Adiutrix sp.]
MRLPNIPVFLSALFLAVLFAAGVMAVEPGHITPEEGKELIQQKSDLVIIDCRNAAEYVTEHYPNALNIPVNELEARLSEVPAGKPVVVYCGLGMRSARAYDTLKDKRPDITELYHINGAPIFD